MVEVRELGGHGVFDVLGFDFCNRVLLQFN